jgi:peptidyl-prolyl cis-trans isomerase C
MNESGNLESEEKTGRPILHLLIFGALLALIIAVAKGPPGESENVRRVVVTDADVEHVKARFARTWNRPPTAIELRDALGQYVRDEILYREAMERGLDRGDPTVRLVMVRKITMLGTSQIDASEPTGEEIKAYFSLRQERYRIPATVSIRQIHFSPDLRGEQAKPDAEQMLERIRAQEPSPEELAELGDPIMLQNAYASRTEKDLNMTFGGGFGTAVIDLEPGRWQGPVESGYGLHLVKVTERRESRIPEWTEVASEIRNDMQYEARRAAEDQLYQEIAARYHVAYEGEAAEMLAERVP